MPHRLTLSRMSELIRARKLSPVELMDAHLKQIEKHNPSVNAFIRLFEEPARAAAQTAEQALSSGGPVLPALCTGPPLRIAFDPAVLLPALEAGVGPDVLLDVASAAEPVVVRSADQGSFTTLVMPVHSP